MTAIGFLLVTLSLFAGWVDKFIDLPEWLTKIFGIAAISGVLMLFSGVVMWMWKVMP